VKGILNFEYVYLIFVFLSALASIKSFRLKWSYPLRMFSTLLFITFFVEVFAITWEWVLYKYNWWNLPKSNLWIYNAFTIIRYLILMLFFYRLIYFPIIKKMIFWLSIPLMIFFIINYSVIQKPFAVNSYTLILTNIVIICTVLFFFKQLLDDKKIIPLTSSTEVWIAVGILLYYSGSLPLFISFNRLINSNLELLSAFLLINDSLNLIMYSLFFIAYLCRPQILK
jgi:hypothetical protein